MSGDSETGSGAAQILMRVATLVGSRIGGSLLTLAYTLLIARMAAPEQFGAFMTCLSWAMLLSIALSLNVEAGSIRYLVAYRNSGQAGKVAGFLRFNLLIVLGLSALCAAGVAVAVATGQPDPTTETGRAWLFAFLTAPLFALTRVYGRHATALDSVLKGSLPQMLVRPTVFCTMLGIVYLMDLGVTADILTGLLFVATALTALLQAFLLRHTFAFARSAEADFGDWRSWIQTGTMMAPLLIVKDNLKNVIVVSAGLALAADQVGYLALALSILSIIHFGVTAVDVSLSPRLSAAFHAGHGLRVARLLRAGGALKLVGTGVGLVALLVAGEWVLSGFGPQYLAALVPLQLLMIIPAADAIFGPTYVVLNISGRPNIVFWVSSASSVAIVLATAVGGATLGTAGAALGAGLAYLFQQITLWRACRRPEGIETSLYSFLAPPPVLAARD